MPTRPDPRGSGAVEIATRNAIIPGSRGLAQAHPLTKAPAMREQPSAGLGPVAVHPIHLGVGPRRLHIYIYIFFFSFFGVFRGSDPFSRVGWGEGEPGRSVIFGNLPTRPYSTRYISITFRPDPTLDPLFFLSTLLIRPAGRIKTREKPS